MRFKTAITLSVMALAAGGIAASAQTVGDDGSVPNIGLSLPSTITPLAGTSPKVRKATAIVNGDVITGTDVEHRLALIILANGGKIAEDEKQRLRVQILSNLIDESLQIQEAKANDIVVKKAEIDQSFARVGQGFKRTPAQMADYLKANGSSERSIKRQIEGEMAWSRLLNRKISVNISEEEVKAAVERLTKMKGTTEYRVGEIYMSATPETQEQVFANMNKILEQLHGGGSFAAYARQFSESSLASVGGDMGFVRRGRLPTELDAVLPTMQMGQVVGPLAVSGGFSILYLIDTKKILVADPRDAIMSLRQIAISFAPGLTATQAQARADSFVKAIEKMQGCGGAEAVAKEFGGEIVDNDRMAMRDLPPALQDMLLPLQVGQSTQPFGTQKEGVRVLTVCGRDDPPSAGDPSAEQIEAQLQEERVNRRAQVLLRDLRRDAIIDYR